MYDFWHENSNLNIFDHFLIFYFRKHLRTLVIEKVTLFVNMDGQTLILYVANPFAILFKMEPPLVATMVSV